MQEVLSFVAQISDPSLRPENILPSIGRRLHGISFYQYYAETTSTNDCGKEHARAGAPEIGVIVAERQTAGRGRMGRKWISESGGGLWMSMLVRPQLDTDQMGVLSLASGLALYRALKSLYRLDELSLKWPNDILVSGAKLAGVLVEAGSSPSGVKWAIVGIGVNILATPGAWEEVATPPAFLAEKVGGSVARGTMLLRLLEEFIALYRSETFVESVLAGYLESCETIGKDIAVTTQHGVLSGKAIGVDRSGSLLVRESGSEKVICLDAQEVSLRGRLPGGTMSLEDKQ